MLFSEQILLNTWEECHSLDPLQRALVILQTAMPEMDLQTLAMLSKGYCDALLIRFYKNMFSSHINGWTECEYCSEKLQVTFNLSLVDLKDLHNYPDSDNLYFEKKGYEINYHLPNTQDLLNIRNCDDDLVAVDQLFSACIKKAKYKGKEIITEKLPVYILKSLENEMEKIDVMSNIKLHVQCHKCSGKFDINFDIISFLWDKLNIMAEQLLYEIHCLAYYYSWNEEDILKMSPVRRKKYMDLM